MITAGKMSLCIAVHINESKIIRTSLPSSSTEASWARKLSFTSNLFLINSVLLTVGSVDR